MMPRPAMKLPMRSSARVLARRVSGRRLDVMNVNGVCRLNLRNHSDLIARWLRWLQPFRADFGQFMLQGTDLLS
jgi:hypothetical protein